MLNFYNIEIGGKDYKCKLTTSNIILCEEKLKGNLLQIFFNMRTGKLPTVNEMVTIFHYALQAYNHGISMEDSCTLFDAWLEDHQIMEFVKELVEIFKVSGLVKVTEKEAEEETDEKN